MIFIAPLKQRSEANRYRRKKKCEMDNGEINTAKLLDDWKNSEVRVELRQNLKVSRFDATLQEFG